MVNDTLTSCKFLNKIRFVYPQDVNLLGPPSLFDHILSLLD